MMQPLYLALALFLLGTLIGGLWRVRRGPTRADTMLAGQLLGTTGTAILLLLAELLESPGARDVALVFALLAIVNVYAFVHRRWRGATE